MIRQMVADLNTNVKIVAVPIVREADGLALSSRNQFLNATERQAALVLSRSLRLAEKMLQAGERDAATLLAAMNDCLSQEPLAVIDYVEIVDTQTLLALPRIEGAALIAMAVRFGKTRLIDNLLWGGN